MTQWPYDAANLDKVIIFLLQVLALTVRSSWGVKEAQAVERELGIPVITEDNEEMHPYVPVFNSPADRNDFLLRSKLFEKPGGAPGLVNQEVAQDLLKTEGREHIEDCLLAISAFSGEDFVVGTLRYNAVAKRYLERLAFYKFSHIPDNFYRALAPFVEDTCKQISQLTAEV